METENFFSMWSEKLSMSEEELKAEELKMIEDEKRIHPQNTDEQHQKRAIQRLSLTYKKQLRSPAIEFQGMIIGVGDLVDTVQRLKVTATTAYRENAQKAIADGLTNTDGIPLDNRQVFSTGRENAQFGKPLPEHNYLRNVVGIALRSKVEESPKMFSMTMNGKLAEGCNVEMFKPLRFRAINKSEEGSSQFVMNGSTVTKFVIDDTIKMPAPIDVLQNVCGEQIVPLNDLATYHEANKTDWNRLALVEGDVSILNTEPTAFGSRMMIIENAETALENLDAPGLTCWIPSSVNLDFAEGSKVIVIGKTAQGKSRDDPNVLGDVMMNVLGVYAIPEYKIEPEAEIVEDIEGIAIADGQPEPVSTVTW